jgi:hypothetical protein
MQGKYMKAFVTAAAILLVAGPSLAGGPKGTGTVSSADVNVNGTNPNIDGTTTTYRGATGIGMNSMVTGLRPGFPYTVWAVIFNYPQKCANFPAPCEPSDFDPTGPTQTRVTQASLNYADENGNSVFTGFVPVGGALFNANRAEVHFVYRRHPNVDGGEYDSLNDVVGNCENGEGGADNQCQDEGFSIHER